MAARFPPGAFTGHKILTIAKCVRGLALACLLLAASQARPASRARRVVMVLLPAVQAGDLDASAMPNFRWMAGHGAVGLMNTRTAVPRWPPEAADLTVDPSRGSAYVTLGAGTRCAVGPPGAEGYLRSERTAEGSASEVYARRNEARAPGAAFQLNPTLIQEQNEDLGYRAQPGALGDRLHAAGMKTAVVGEADRPAETHREGILAAMDSRGGVDAADFATSVRRPQAAFGREMSLDEIDRSLAGAPGSADLIVIDWGDTARLDDQRANMLPSQAARATGPAMRRVDLLFGLLRRRLNLARDRLLIVSPYPSRGGRAAYDTLTPAIMVGDGVRAGLLTSPTTRRAGIIANVDIAPAVASSLGIARLPATMVGRPLASLPPSALPMPAVQRSNGSLSSSAGGSAWERLLGLRDRLLEVERERRIVLHDLVSFLTWAMAGFALLFGVAKGRAASWVPPGLALLPAALPLALLLAALVRWPSAALFSLAVWGMALALAAGASACARIRGRAADGAGVLALATAAAVIADGLAGFPHMPFCILSYSMMEGARYYGIGNEYMGAFLAATALGGTALFRQPGTRLAPGAWIAVAGLFLLATVVLAGPAFGAKFGGGIAAAGAFGSCLLLLSGRRPRWAHLVWVIGAVIAAVALMIVFDRMRGGGSTHIARAFADVQRGGWAALALILQRKGSMNVHLFVYSPWSRLMGLGLLASVLGLRSRRLRGLATWPEGPLGAGIAGALAAALIALLVDDAGVLAAATALIFVPPALVAAEGDHIAADLIAGERARTPQEIGI